MNPILTWPPLSLKLRKPFRLADDSGWGESAIPPYYGVAQNAMIACWEAAAQKQQPLLDEPEEIAGWVGVMSPDPARCALELALYDRIAWGHGLPLYALPWVAP